MVCTKHGRHLQAECEDVDQIAASRLKKMKSDLFDIRGSMPAAQHEIMKRNASAAPFLQLPVEIRLWIYKLVLGGHQLWIGYEPPTTVIPHSNWIWGTLGSEDHPKVHNGGGLFTRRINNSRGIELGLLRVSRHIFTETSLLLYELNSFAFESKSTLRAFQRHTRPGRKRVQKKAMGLCKICPFSTEYVVLHNEEWFQLVRRLV